MLLWELFLLLFCPALLLDAFRKALLRRRALAMFPFILPESELTAYPFEAAAGMALFTLTILLPARVRKLSNQRRRAAKSNDASYEVRFERRAERSGATAELTVE